MENLVLDHSDWYIKFYQEDMKEGSYTRMKIVDREPKAKDRVIKSDFSNEFYGHKIISVFKDFVKVTGFEIWERGTFHILEPIN